MSETPSGVIAQQGPRPMEEDADAAATVKRAADEVVGDDEPSAKKPKQEDGPDPAKPAGEGDDDGLGTDDDDDDEPKDDIKRFAARLRPWTSKSKTARLRRTSSTIRSPQSCWDAGPASVGSSTFSTRC